MVYFYIIISTEDIELQISCTMFWKWIKMNLNFNSVFLV